MAPLHAWTSEVSGGCALYYILPEYDHVSITLYNSIGKRISALADGYESSGVHSIALATQSEISFCRIIVGGKTTVLKIAGSM
jgi:hypothetical protein